MKLKGNPSRKATSHSDAGPQIQAFIEKRKTLRNPLFVLEVKWKHYDEVFLANTENISVGGLFMLTDRAVQVGEQFPIKFILPDHITKVNCTGKVVWTRRDSSEGTESEGIGVRFLDLATKEMKAIEQWLQKQGSRSKKKT